MVSKCEKAPRGTALLIAEEVAPAEPAPVLGDVVVLGLSALVGGVRMLEDGVNAGVVVRAFDPAEDEPDDAKDDAAPVPVAPADAFDWM